MKPKQSRRMKLAILVAATSILYSVNASATSCASDWKEGQNYKAGSVAQYRGHNYQVTQPHVALVGAGWTPARFPALWKDLGNCTVITASASTSALTSAVPAQAAPVPRSGGFSSGGGG